MKSAMLAAVALILGLTLGSFLNFNPLASARNLIDARTRSYAYCDRVDVFDKYACLVEAAGKGAATLYPDAKRAEPYLVALSAMQTVQTIASSPRYAYLLNTIAGFDRPPSRNQRPCLESGFGICGNQMLVFNELVRRAGLPVRTTQFYYRNPATGLRESHACAEVFIDDKWRFIDVTWGSVWLTDAQDITTMQSLDEIEAAPGHRLTQQLDPWYYSQLAIGHTPMDYIALSQADDASIVRGGKGTVIVPLIKTSNGALKADFSNVPNLIGDSRDDGKRNAETLMLRLPDVGPYIAHFDVSHISSCRNSQMEINGKAVAPRAGTIATEVQATPVRIAMKGDDAACYAEFAALSFNPMS